nr:GNAT family N-acetyltransferase [Methylobacterium brachythecii]
MPERIADRPNPLALLGTLPCPLNGNVVRTGDDWNAYHHSLKRTVRKELERAWRVFERHPAAAFRPIDDPAERLHVLRAIEVQQPLRMESTHKTYVLDEPNAAAFYRNLVESPATKDAVILTALTAGEEVVAALLGLHHDGEYIMVRISNAEGVWSNASPGRIIIDKSMEWLHGRGHRHFDFSIGNYDYKRRFGVEPIALVDLVRPLGLRGLPAKAELHARAWLRRHPRARALAERALGRAPKTAP